MHLTNNDLRGHKSAVASDISEATGAPEAIEITAEMEQAGADILIEALTEGSNLLGIPAYVAGEVYRAMDRLSGKRRVSPPFHY